MKHLRLQWLLACFVPLLCPVPLRAQSTLTAFLPEVDSYFRLHSNFRLVLQAKGYMEDGDLDHAQVGPSLQFNVRPFEKLKKITLFELDDVKCTPFVMTVGYRYLPSSVQAATQRFQPMAMFHIPLPGRMLLTDRSRADLDWTNGAFNWTYRNRITAERRLHIRSYHPDPYIAGEFSYQSQYSKWSATRLLGGCLLPLSRHTQLDAYYQHVNNTGVRPNRQVNAVGTIVNFYFPPYKG